MLDFRVYTFLAVCEYMNYTRAAEALHITQPAVSQHIRYLENMYQVKLFLAEGKKIHCPRRENVCSTQPPPLRMMRYSCENRCLRGPGGD